MPIMATNTVNDVDKSEFFITIFAFLENCAPEAKQEKSVSDIILTPVHGQ
jgi:hypothetical protein